MPATWVLRTRARSFDAFFSFLNVGGQLFAFSFLNVGGQLSPTFRSASTSEGNTRNPEGNPRREPPPGGRNPEEGNPRRKEPQYAPAEPRIR